MGEISEMMLDGTLCEGCGEFLNEDPPGYPCYCESRPAGNFLKMGGYLDLHFPHGDRYQGKKINLLRRIS